MPRTTALMPLDATLDAATAIADTLLADTEHDRTVSDREQALQRACVVLCATAWETYTEDSLIWVAERAGASAQSLDQLDDSPATAHLADLARASPEDLRAAFERTRWKKNKPVDAEGRASFEASRQDDEAWLAEKVAGPWPKLLELDLRRRILGLHHWNGSGRYTDDGPHRVMGSPTFRTVARWQEVIYGERFIEQVRLPGHQRRYVAKWLDVLVEVRNASVHRGETPGPLDTGGVREWIEFVHDVAHYVDRLISTWADQHLPLLSQP